MPRGSGGQGEKSSRFFFLEKVSAAEEAKVGPLSLSMLSRGRVGCLLLVCLVEINACDAQRQPHLYQAHTVNKLRHFTYLLSRMSRHVMSFHTTSDHHVISYHVRSSYHVTSLTKRTRVPAS